MSNIKKLMMSAASGDAPLSVEDVFSTYLYTGNGSSQSISNGINLNTTDTTSASSSIQLNYYQTSPQSSYREYNIGKVVEDSSGNYYVIATFKEGYYGHEQNTLTKFSSSGTQVWSKRLQDTSSPKYADFDDMVLNSNGDLVITWTASSDNDRAKVNVLSASDGSTVSGASNSATSTAPHRILHSGSSIYWTGKNSYSSIFIASETAPGTITGTRAIGLGSYTQRVMLIPQSSGGPVVVGYNNDQNSGTSTNGWIFTKLASNLQSSTYTTRHSHSTGSSTQYNSRYMDGGKQYYDATDNMLYIFWRGTNSISGNTSHYNYISKFDMDDGSHVVSKRIYFNSSSTSNIDATSIIKFNNKIIACGSGYDSATKKVILECSTDLSTISARTVTLPDYRDNLQIWGGSQKIYYVTSDHGQFVKVTGYEEFDIDAAVLGVTPTSSGITVTSASLTDTTTGYNNVSVSNGTATDNMGNSAGTPTDNTTNMVESSENIPEILEVGQGGMVWFKRRSNSVNHLLQDTERGTNKTLWLNEATDEQTQTDCITSYNFTGFSIGNDTTVNTNNETYASWTFKKVPKFFDVVTYTGTGNSQTNISHNLGTDIGMIVIKRLDGSGNWLVWHRGNGSSDYTGLRLNSTDTSAQINPNSYQYFTSSTFRPTYVYDTDNSTNGNVNGAMYVAYLFAHNNNNGSFGPNGNADIIKCGAYTGTSNSNAINEIDLGFEPQWLLIKGANYGTGWQLYDSMRGLVTNGNDARLYTDTSAAEGSTGDVDILSNGFAPASGSFNTNYQGKTYIYMAIRRGQMKIPTSASQVFSMSYQSTGEPSGSSGFVADAATRFYLSSSSSYPQLSSRLTSGKYLRTSQSSTETTLSSWVWDMMDGFGRDIGGTSTTLVSHIWKRAPNFFDVVTYTGTGSSQSINHNLGVAPEMMWVKNRSSAANWSVYHKDLSSSGILRLNQNVANQTGDGPHIFGNGSTLVAPTSTVFTVGSADGTSNTSGSNYIIYLFASLDGIAKVGSYTGNGGTSVTGTGQNIDCGFSGGARFVMIKPTNAADNWFIYDTKRGISDQYEESVSFNLTNGESSGSDEIDPLSSGFTILNGNNQLNRTGREYIFYAIA